MPTETPLSSAARQIRQPVSNLAVFAGTLHSYAEKNAYVILEFHANDEKLIHLVLGR